jgi:hypothetical protein
MSSNKEIGSGLDISVYYISRPRFCAQLGAFYKVPHHRCEVPIGQSLTRNPYRVSRGLCGAGKLANNSREAYTWNTAGRRGDVPPLSNSAS